MEAKGFLSRGLFRPGVAGVLLGCGLVSCGSDPARKAAAPPAEKVKVETAALEPVPDWTEYLATLESRSAAVLMPEVDGQIRKIMVRAGDSVKQGQPLLEIDPRKQQATVTSQQAQQRSQMAALEYARDDLNRKKQLAAAGVISRQELDQAQSTYDTVKANVEALKASVQEQQVQLRYYLVRAPRSGTIGDIPVREGDRVTTSTVLTTVDEPGGLEAYISVPAEKSAEVHAGMAVDIVDETGKPVLRLAVTFVSPRVDPTTQLLLLKARLPARAAGFRNDELVHVHLIWSQTPRISIPVTAITRIGGQPFGFVAEKEAGKVVARQRTLHLGDINGNSYVVLEGIKPGETIITTSVQTLHDGTTVEPQS